MAVDAGTIYSEVRVHLSKVQNDLKAVTTEFDKFAKTNDLQAKGIEKKWSDVTKNISLMGVASFAALGIAVKTSISAFADFEQSIANIKSVSSGTEEEFLKLENAAREAGLTTKFAAREAADAMYYLASAGFNATQSMTALNGVLTLAGATQSNLEFTAETVAATISGFGLKAEDATRVANVFAASIGKSQATMDKLANAMRQVAPVAGALGISLEDVTGALDILFDAGFRGEQAGMALRNVLADMSDNTSPVVTKLRALGLSFEEVNPKVVGLSGAIANMARVGISADQAISIFGKHAGAEMAVLIQKGAKAINEATAEITGTSEATKQYEIQMNTLSGSLDKMKARMQEIAIAFVQNVGGGLKAIIDIFNNLLKVVSELPAPVQVFIGVLAAAIPIVGGLALAFTALGGVLAVLTGPIGLISIGIAGIVTLFSVLNKDATLAEKRIIKLSEGFNKNKNAADDLLRSYDKLNDKEKLRTETADELIKLYPQLAKKVDVYSDSIKKVSDELEKLQQKEAIRALRDQIKDVKAYAIELENQEKVLAQFNAQKASFQKMNQEELRQIKEALDIAQEGLGASLEKLNKSALKFGYNFDKNLNIYAVALEKTTQAADDLIKKETEKKEAAKLSADADKALIATTLDYEAKLKSIGATEAQLIDIERDRAKAAVDASGGTAEAMKEAKEAIDAYYDRLKEDTAHKEFVKNIKQMASDSLTLLGGLFGAMSSLYGAIADARIAELDRELQAELERRGIAEETELERLQTQLDAAIAAGDTETAAKLEDEIERTKLTEEYEKKKAQIGYRAELAQWKLNLAQAYVSAANAIMSIFSTWAKYPWVAGPMVAAQGVVSGIQIAAINKAKPKPPQFEKGGLVIGSNNKSGTIVSTAENGTNELLFNSGQSGEPFIEYFAQKMAEIVIASLQNNPNHATINLNMDGKYFAKVAADYYNRGEVTFNLSRAGR